MSRPTPYMPAWVRYSVAVYLGLLLAGSLVETRPHATADTGQRYAGAGELLIPPQPQTPLREQMRQAREQQARGEPIDPLLEGALRMDDSQK